MMHQMCYLMSEQLEALLRGQVVLLQCVALHREQAVAARDGGSDL